MAWKIIATKTFSKEFKKYSKNNEFNHALDNKIKRLKENPEIIGGNLSGQLHGYKSTRIIRKFRLIFKILHENKSVQLIAIDHRKRDYKDIL
jgi:addiction module RelE/StbE family toxin